MEIIAISADNDNIDLGAFSKVLGAVLTAGDAADATAAIYDSLTVTGTAKLTLKAAQKTSCPVHVGQPGALFKTGISVDMTGANAILYLFVE